MESELLFQATVFRKIFREWQYWVFMYENTSVIDLKLPVAEIVKRNNAY